MRSCVVSDYHCQGDCSIAEDANLHVNLVNDIKNRLVLSTLTYVRSHCMNVSSHKKHIYILHDHIKTIHDYHKCTKHVSLSRYVLDMYPMG